MNFFRIIPHSLSETGGRGVVLADFKELLQFDLHYAGNEALIGSAALNRHKVFDMAELADERGKGAKLHVSD